VAPFAGHWGAYRKVGGLGQAGLFEPGGENSLGCMGISETYEAPEGWHAALAALAWQVDLGVGDVIGDAPINRYDLVEVQREAAVVPQGVQGAVPADAAGRGAVAEMSGGANNTTAAAAKAEVAVAAARAAAGAAGSLAELRAALAGFEHCEIKQGDGNPAARVLILGEAPGSEEDREGRPFVGPAGQLLDKMFAAIGLSRTALDPAEAVYITNVMPWRPPQNRDPSNEEIAMMRLFVERHIALVNPDVIVLMGNTPCATILETRGILKLRGVWAQALGKPVLPMAHPAYLLRNPIAKREAWADLLAIRERLGG
jgi:uracil-DNA glycosylase